MDETGYTFRARFGTTWAPIGHPPVLRRVSQRDGDLQAPPGGLRELKRELGRDQVEAHPVGVGDLHVYPVSSLDHIEKARPVFSDLSPFLRRLSLRRKSPHLIVTCTLPVRSTPPARELFEKLREIAGLVR
ncbi:MAG: hypothetical protein QN189_05510 [Armatimonadota bacterium]|nr:hypothetical protein [Armatimonadota bacterium]